MEPVQLFFQKDKLTGLSGTHVQCYRLNRNQNLPNAKNVWASKSKVKKSRLTGGKNRKKSEESIENTLTTLKGLTRS